MQSNRNIKYTFSGHESFPCKSLWLKKGYDFMVAQYDFNSPDAVVRLGVGKNMVASIRYWMKCFGLTKDNALTDIAQYIFDTEKGNDPFIEDLGTLWLLHFLLIYTNEATLYNLFFTRFQRERKQFTKEHLCDFVHRKMKEANEEKAYNANTVGKDVNVLLQNYVLPKSDRSFEDFSSLLIDLDLIHASDQKEKDKSGKAINTYYFNIEAKREVTPEIFLYAIVKMKNGEMTVPYDTLQNVGTIFCMNDIEIISMLKRLATCYSEYVSYSDVAGIRQLQFTREMNERDVLDRYYKGAENAKTLADELEKK